MIVVDSSALVEVLIDSPDAPAIAAVLFDARHRSRLCAPHLIDVEIAQVVRRLAARRAIHAQRAQAALDALIVFPLYRYPYDVLVPRIWGLRANLTAYDAVYVALAEALDAPLLTHDAKLAAPGVRAELIVV